MMAEMAVVDHELFRSIRNDIRRGHGAKRLRDEVSKAMDQQESEEYDQLDALVSGVLSLDEPDAATIVREPEMVFYQPTPARHIFDFIDRAAIRSVDAVMDLGSGLGHVAIVTAICTGARCMGVEREAAYVASAQQCAKGLRITHAHFIQQDVRYTQLSEATVFYLYTPFTGTILRTVLDMLKREAATRELRIGTLGPCSEIIAQEPWLKADGVCDPGRMVLFRNF